MNRQRQTAQRSATTWVLALVLWLLSAVVSQGQAPAAGAQAQPKPEPKAAEQKPAEQKPAGQKPAEQAEPEQKEFFIHAFHATQLSLDCSTCHVPVKGGSVELKRPGHDQCMACHQDAFGDNLNPKICAQCHSAFPPTSAEDILPFPQYKKRRAILFDFSHAMHVDPHGRLNPKTGFRADCTYCHQFDAQGIYAKFPGHVQCAGCHSKEGMKPRLTAASDTKDCRGCHTPEEIENPGFTEQRRMIADHVVSGVHVNLKFSHIAHFRVKDQYNLNCTTCHYAVPTSTSLTNLTLPRMVDCVACHDESKGIAKDFRMTNCGTCHVDAQASATFIPASHTRWVKPAFHNESFRVHHEEQAAAPGAKCFVCHTNVSPSAAGEDQCLSCHQVMRPSTHTARWRDDVHGKVAALDRTTCAMCHTADYCIRCHNEIPRSHQPLALFEAGAHARAAMLDERSCLTCHTFENTCAACHKRALR